MIPLYAISNMVDANGREHAPSGSPEGGQFVGKGETNSLGKNIDLSPIKTELSWLHQKAKEKFGDSLQSIHLVGSWAEQHPSRMPDRRGKGTSDIDLMLDVGNDRDWSKAAELEREYKAKFDRPVQLNLEGVIGGKVSAVVKSASSPVESRAKKPLGNVLANGGEGSGNFGHEGRPGQVGGSAPSGSASPHVEKWATEKFGAEKGKAFSDWFAGSKVVNEKGEPLVVYHGTRSNISQFDPDKSWTGLGLHFGSQEQAEASFVTSAAGKRAKIGRVIMPVFISLQNPLRLEDEGDWDSFEVRKQLVTRGLLSQKESEAIEYSVKKMMDKTKPERPPYDKWFRNIDAERSRRVRHFIESKGYDGVVYANHYEGAGDSYIAFHPTQIKSVWNKGAWSKSDASISNALANAESPANPIVQQFIAGRKMLPTTLRSGEFAETLGKDVMRRSLFVSQMTEARFLDQVAGALQDIVAEGMDASQARLQLKAYLDSMGYVPEENGIMNLAGDARLNLILDTQIGLAQGYGHLIRSVDPDILQEFPAWRLERWETRKVPRDWDERWFEAAEGTPEEGRNDEEKVARKDHPIWKNLGSSAIFDDALDVTYPPFCFNSGMGVYDLNRDEAIMAGVIDGQMEVDEVPVPGFNDELTLSMSDFTMKGIADALLESNPKITVDKEGVAKLAN